MTDLSAMSDGALMNAYATARAGAASSDPRMMSDAQLTAAYQSAQQASGLPMNHLGPASGAVSAFENFTDQAVRPFTFGLADKAGALVPAINNAVAGAFGGGNGQTFGQNYQAELAREGEQSDVYAQAHPIASPIATALGTVASVAPKAALSPVAMSIPTRGLADLLKEGMTVGGLTGLGSANDQSLSGDVKAAATGAAAGGATSGLVGTLGPKIASAAGNFISQHLGHRLSPIGLMFAALEGIHNPEALAYVVPGALGLYGASQIPARAAHALIPLAARGAASVAPALASSQPQP